MTGNNDSRVRITCIVLGAAGAGKTSILRRYFSGTFQKQAPTLGSDFFTGRVPNPLHEKESKADEAAGGNVNPQPSLVTLQVWDTAGRARNAKYIAALSDEFFRHADATMLVYDASSSSSFTHLINLYSELIERMEDLEQGRRMPVLVVANKQDAVESKRRFKPIATDFVKTRRDVMGLKGNFKGKNGHYEYRPCLYPQQCRQEKQAFHPQTSTYMEKGNAWATDRSYLDFMYHSEDTSHPDREMVMLWCKRSGLKHVEVSALSGNGIDCAMESLVELALEARQNRMTKCKLGAVNVSHLYQSYHPNKELDLHSRYAPPERLCFGIIPFRFC